MKSIIEAVKELDRVKRQAMAFGLFAVDRKLLECPSCGMWEDVTIEGLLIVYQKDDPSREDSKLRFKELDESHFVCPACGITITVEDEDGGEARVNPADAGGETGKGGAQ